MSCPGCPEPKQSTDTPIQSDSFCIMPRDSNTTQLANLLRHANLTVSDDCVIESDIPISGLRQEGNRYHLDWVTCTWRLLDIKLPKIEVQCLLKLDVSKCETCPRRHA